MGERPAYSGKVGLQKKTTARLRRTQKGLRRGCSSMGERPAYSGKVGLQKKTTARLRRTQKGLRRGCSSMGERPAYSGKVGFQKKTTARLRRIQEGLRRGCSSMGERSVRIRKVGGSSPLSSTMVISREAFVGLSTDDFFVARVFCIPRTTQRGQVLCNGTLLNPARSGRKQRSANRFV
jgi:hypothetical protein